MSPKQECQDNDNERNCSLWKESGECEKNPSVMYEKCRLSCDMCDVRKRKLTEVEGNDPACAVNITCPSGENCDAANIHFLGVELVPGSPITRVNMTYKEYLSMTNNMGYEGKRTCQNLDSQLGERNHPLWNVKSGTFGGACNLTRVITPDNMTVEFS